MPERSGLRELARWSSETTSVGGIERALERLSVETSDPDITAFDAQAGVPRRARVANLMLFVRSRQLTAQVATELEELLADHPVRTLVLLADRETAESSLGASVHVYENATSGRRRCFEQIHLLAKGDAVDRLPGIAAQLLLPGLATALWWPEGDRLDSMDLKALSAQADALIVDSRDFTEPSNLSTLAAVTREAGGQLSVADLNWDRLADWRELIAQFFDGPRSQSCLGQISQVEIGSDCGPGCATPPAQALLLVGWLAACLGWTAAAASSVDDDGWGIEMHEHRRPINIRMMRSGDRGVGTTGAVTELILEAATEAGQHRFSLSSLDGGRHGTTTVALGGQTANSRTFLLEQPGIAAMLAEKVESMGHDRALEEALVIASSLTTTLSR